MIMTTRHSTFLLAAAVLSPGPLACHAQGWDDSYKLDFSYDPDANNGPNFWDNAEGIGLWSQYNNRLIEQSSASSQCGSTSRRPSPLNLVAEEQTCQDVHELLPRQISDSDCTRDDMTFEITPYTLRAYLPLSDDDNDSQCENPTLVVPGRFDLYSLLWMEIHARAEHVMDGKRYDAELQMVHQGTGFDDGQLMIVSLMIDASATRDDLEFEWLLQQWGQVAQNENDACEGRKLRTRHRRRHRQLQRQEPVSDSQPRKKKKPQEQSESSSSSSQGQRDLQFRPSPCQTDKFGAGCEPLGPRRRMYPYSLWPSIWYYGYTGSLTAPPCSDIVQWRILDEPMRISRRQYKQLTRLLTLSRDESCEKDTATSSNGENYRSLEEKDGFFQTIFHCTPDDFGFFAYSPEEQ